MAARGNQARAVTACTDCGQGHRASACPRRPRAVEWWTPQPIIWNPTVYDAEPVNTGLVDQHGRPLMRGPEPIGFLRFS